MTSEFYFFTGENDYALEKELLRWKAAFCTKHGPENFLEMQGKDSTSSDLLDAVSVMPFIAERRLVFIRGLPKIEKEELKQVADNIHPQVIVAMIEAKPDKRLGIVKTIAEVAQTKEFTSLSPRDLQAWAKDLVAKEDASIGDAAWKCLLQIVGTDQWMLDAELRKLSAFAGGKEITVSHTEELAVPSGEQVVWRMTDLIGGRKADEALAFFHNRLDRGEDPYGIWVILLNMVKNLTLVWAGLEDGLRDDRSIASAFGIHFFSVRGLLPLARSMSKEKVSALLNFAATADLALKTGGHHYTAERQEELIALTERTILLCR